MKPYPEYKPTCLAWLPEIPKHWDWIMLSQIATEQCNKNAERTERNVLSLSYGRIIQKKNLFAGLSPQDYGTYQIISPGNIVMRLTDLQNDHKSLRTGLAEMRGIITSAYTCLKTNHNPAFLHYLLYCYDIRKVFYGLGGGVRQSIGFKDIRGLRFPFPPADEQAQIVRYLDAMTAKINKLIRAKKTVNELIMEQLIEKANRCVNDKKLKRYRLKNILTLVSDEIDRKDDILYSPVGVLNRGRGVFHKPELLGKELGNSTFFHVYPGDMIFSGQFAWEGAVGILQDSEKGCIASHRYPLARAVDPDVLKLEYLWAFFQTKYGDMILNTHSYGAAGRNRPLNIQRLLAEDIPLPSIAEQNDFVILFRQLQKAKLLATKYTKQLQDYKDALIAAVVTGKVDVRNIVVEAVSPEDLAPSDDPDESEEQDSTVPEDSED